MRKTYEKGSGDVLWGEHILRVFENNVLRGALGHKKEKGKR
jgi:hypothetical protein